MNEQITQNLSIPVTQTADVLVAGGGIAGVAAALAAARSGKKVLLCEREYLPGGLATLGMVVIYLPLDDGNGKQVSFGIAEELLRLSLKDGKLPWIEKSPALATNFWPEPWLRDGTKEERIRTRFQSTYNAYSYALALEQLLRKEGVEILYGTWVADAAVKDGAITHVILENIDGRTAVAVSAAVDATGDAVLARAAGEETALFSCGNVRSCWYLAGAKGDQFLVELSESIARPDRPAAPGQTVISGVDARENSRFLQESHDRLLADLARRRKIAPDAQILTMATIPDHRMTRRIVGVSQSERSHEGAFLPDSVGCFANWIRADGGYELPFGALFGNRVKNLAVAGRCLSAADDMWDLTRVIPVCAVSGEAAGVAAAMSPDLHALPVSDLQAELARRGVKLHLN
ncbi:MAG: FAD-dependent oxidoreductase [Clostridia bacterium]|nr:FAD-dependent oxidoreductase [Clostridia bacterium]